MWMIPIHLHVNQKFDYNDDEIDVLSPKVIILFLCSTQLSMQFFMLINVKMQIFVGILTYIYVYVYISMINTTSESLEARNVLIFQHFSFL